MDSDAPWLRGEGYGRFGRHERKDQVEVTQQGVTGRVLIRKEYLTPRALFLNEPRTFHDVWTMKDIDTII